MNSKKGQRKELGIQYKMEKPKKAARKILALASYWRAFSSVNKRLAIFPQPKTAPFMAIFGLPLLGNRASPLIS